jgi:hypothetical protein
VKPNINSVGVRPQLSKWASSGWCTGGCWFHCGWVEDLEALKPFFWVAKFGQKVKLKNQKFENKLILEGFNSLKIIGFLHLVFSV